MPWLFNRKEAGKNKVCNKTRSTPVSILFKSQDTEHTTIHFISVFLQQISTVLPPSPSKFTYLIRTFKYQVSIHPLKLPTSLPEKIMHIFLEAYIDDIIYKSFIYSLICSLFLCMFLNYFKTEKFSSASKAAAGTSHFPDSS